MNLEMRDFAIRDLGCTACSLFGQSRVPCEKHHLLTTGLHGNGRRRGEQYTVGLCAYHHRGVTHGSGLAEVFWCGPSYAHEPAAFRERWPDDWLLERQETLLREWRGSFVGGIAG